MSAMRVIAVLLFSVVIISCSGQPAGQAESDGAANQPAGEEVFDDDFESGETDEWKAEGKEAPAEETETEPETETEEH